MRRIARSRDRSDQSLPGERGERPSLRPFLVEAIGSERRQTVVRITVELVEVTRQGRRRVPGSVLGGRLSEVVSVDE